MASKDGLIRAMKEMKNGSKQGFATFYRATLQFVYRSALALWRNNEDACLFMADFYPFMYMRLVKFEDDQDIKRWLSDLMVERFMQTTGARPSSINIEAIDKSVYMSKDDADRVWHLLEIKIHFPEEKKGSWKKGLETPIKVLLIVGIISGLALLVLWKIAPSLSSQAKKNDTVTEQKTDQKNEADRTATLQEIEDLQKELQADSANGGEPMTEDEMRELLNSDITTQTKLDTSVGDGFGSYTSEQNSPKTEQTSGYNSQSKVQSNIGTHTSTAGNENSMIGTHLDANKKETVSSDTGKGSDIFSIFAGAGAKKTAKTNTDIKIDTTVDTGITSNEIKLKYGNGLYYAR